MTNIKIPKKVYGTLAFISFFMLIGTAGASDHNTISLAQTIIQGSMSMICFYVFAKLAGAFKQSEDIEVDQQELFRQINTHMPIDGYRIFAERQNGNRYTVTFLSKSNDNCVLAEREQ